MIYKFSVEPTRKKAWSSNKYPFTSEEWCIVKGMIGFLQNIEQLTLQNSNFRQVLYTGQHAQVVLMSLLPSEEIGVEIHEIVDQFLRVESGVGRVVMNGEEHEIKAGDAFVVPAGTQHNVINTSADESLKLYTLYSPPHHKDGTIHTTKQEADADKEDHL